MGDIAEDMGFKWNRSKYPTPGWDIDYTELYNTRFGISRRVWHRELRLWVADCAEHVVHIWEEWATTFRPEHVDAARNAIKAARDYAWGKISREEMSRVRNIIYTYNWGAGSDRILSAGLAAVYAAMIYTAESLQARDWASRAAGNNKKEISWQKEALAKRIDALAPWRLT